MGGGRRGWALAAWLAPACIACSAQVPQAVDGGVTQFSTSIATSGDRVVMIVAVDDGSSPEAQAIRAATVAALPATLQQLVNESASGLDTDWARADVRLVVVHPSIAGSAGASGPNDDPALALITDNATPDAIAETAAAAARAIDGSVAAEGAPYALLNAAAATMDLLTGLRRPADTREEGLLASLGSFQQVALVMATSRDDGSKGGATTRTWWRDGDHPALTLLTSMHAAADGGCAGELDPSTRLGAWLAATQHGFPSADLLFPSCNDESDPHTIAPEGLLPQHVIGDVNPLCLPVPATTPQGAAACRLTATMSGEAPCSTQPGMLDPLDPDGVRRPRLSGDAGNAQRVCEIRALAGAEAAACSARQECSGCSAGWCTTKIADFPECRYLRFVRGAVPRAGATIDVTCDVAR
jgi:hypothetical protein